MAADANDHQGARDAAAREASSLLRFGVAGDPIAHSRSPQIHRAAYAELGIVADYQRLPIPADLFDETIRALPGSGFRGINVTIPHKQAALRIADSASQSATEIGAANTLTFSDGKIAADNTDAPGLLASLPSPVDSVDVLVLGAGGTARAAVWALRGGGARVSIWNRTAERAIELAQRFEADAIGTADGVVDVARVVVNTTAVGMDPRETIDTVEQSLGITVESLRPDAVVVDFVYREGGSPLVNAAREYGLVTIDGNELLIRQAALSFERWFGRTAPLDAMRAALDRP